MPPPPNSELAKLLPEIELAAALPLPLAAAPSNTSLMAPDPSAVEAELWMVLPSTRSSLMLLPGMVTVALTAAARPPPENVTVLVPETLAMP